MWTKENKPSSETSTRVNPQGREHYDQSSITYDDPDVFYDGVNQGAWTKENKPSTSNWTKVNKPT